MVGQAVAVIVEAVGALGLDRVIVEDRALARGVDDGDLTASADLDAIARYYTTVVQGLSVQARDGASRADLEAVITCAMAAWDTLASAER